MSDERSRDDKSLGQEPVGEDSRVEDWFGQSVERNAELAERLTGEVGPDKAAAEFEKRSTGEDEQEARHGEVIDPDQGRSAYTDDVGST